MHEVDIPKTDIAALFGSFEFLRTPFGIKTASQAFQRLTHELLKGLNFVYSYRDDILIVSSTLQHAEHLHQILQRLSDAGLIVTPGKRQFGDSEAIFLGYQVFSTGIQPPKERASAILNYPRPKTVTELKSFLHSVNFYRRAIPKAAELQAPLHRVASRTEKKDRRELKRRLLMQ